MRPGRTPVDAATRSSVASTAVSGRGGVPISTYRRVLWVYVNPGTPHAGKVSRRSPVYSDSGNVAELRIDGRGVQRHVVVADR